MKSPALFLVSAGILALVAISVFKDNPMIPVFPGFALCLIGIGFGIVCGYMVFVGKPEPIFSGMKVGLLYKVLSCKKTDKKLFLHLGWGDESLHCYGRLTETTPDGFITTVEPGQTVSLKDVEVMGLHGSIIEKRLVVLHTSNSPVFVAVG